MFSHSLQEQHPPAVLISTIHSVKGLEFDTVFLGRFNDGFLPASWLRRNPSEEDIAKFERDRAEDHRLAHVVSGLCGW